MTCGPAHAEGYVSSCGGIQGGEVVPPNFSCLGVKGDIEEENGGLDF